MDASGVEFIAEESTEKAVRDSDIIITVNKSHKADDNERLAETRHPSQLYRL